MCTPPRGERRWFYRDPNPVRTVRIAKREVDAIIDEGKYVLTQKVKGRCTEEKCDLKPEELHAILHVATTKPVVAGTDYSEFRRGKRTIIMEGKSINGVIILRQ